MKATSSDASRDKTSDEEASEILERVQVAAQEDRIDPKHLNLREEVINLNRVAKVVKGGRRFSFNAVVAVGDGEGHVGLGFGKANQVPETIAKAVERAKKNLFRVPLLGRTIPHEVTAVYGGARVLLKPASEGTGLIAGPAVRILLQLAGIQDVLSKSLGSDNLLNVAKATEKALRTLKRPEVVARLRGKSIESLLGRKRAALLAQALKAHLRPEAGEAEAPAGPSPASEDDAPLGAAEMDTDAPKDEG